MKRPYIVLIFLFLSLFSLSQTKRLAIIGSSTSACLGFGGPPGDNMNFANCYINRLINYYTGLGITLLYQNDAMSGYNVYQGMPTGSPSIFVTGIGTVVPDPERNITHALAFNPDVIIVNFPTNAYQVMTVQEVMSYLRTIKKAANDAGKPAFITTTQPRNDPPFDPAVRMKLMEIRDSIYLQFGIYAVDFWSTVAMPDGSIDPTYGQGDGIHINYLGHYLFFQRLRNKNIFGIGLVNRATSSGNWDDPAIWENGEVPTSADSVVILGGRTVTLNINTQVRALNVIPTATFTISSSRALKIGN